MWIAKLKARHDCIIGNRCRKFGVTDMGIPFNIYIERGITHAPQIQTLHGKHEAVRNFISDLSKDPRVEHMESDGSTVFLVEKRSDKIPSSFYNPKLILVNPVKVDQNGFEYWEVASWDRKTIEDFVKKMQGDKDIESVKVVRMKKAKLTDVYFMHAVPNLTKAQKTAMELAIDNGYYQWPKKTNLGKLANLMGISVQTYREHLKKAEQKIMPDFARFLG